MTNLTEIQYIYKNYRVWNVDSVLRVEGVESLCRSEHLKYFTLYVQRFRTPIRRINTPARPYVVRQNGSAEPFLLPILN